MEFFSFFYIIIPIIVFVTSIKEGKRLIPKKDAFRVFKQTQIGIVVLALIISGTLLYLQFSLYPTIDRLYQSLNYNNPFPPSFVSYFTFLAIAILIISTVYTISSKSIRKEFEENLISKYKEANMVKRGDLVSKTLMKIMILKMVVVGSVIFIFGILPTFNVLRLASDYTKPLSGEYTVPGIVIKIDTSQMAVDGDGVVTLQTDWGELVVEIPAETGICSADISDFWNLQVGDRAEVAGSFTNGKTTICESPRHFLKRVSEVDTSDWQTCTNSTYGFSIAYPTNFDVDPITCNYAVMEYNRVKDISVVNPIDNFRKNWLLTITADKTLLDVDQWIKSQCPMGSSVGSPRCSEPRPGPIPTSMQYDLLNVHYAGTNTIVKINSTLFDFSLNARNPNTPVSQHIQQVYDQILSTFRFID